MFLPVGIDRPLIRFPYVTIAICLVNILVHIGIVASGDPDRFHVAYGFIPHYHSLMTLFTHMWLHGDWLHLIGNLIFLAVASLKIEDCLGPLKAMIFYIGCGLAANASHNILSGELPIPMIGASGAVAGMLGGFMILFPFNNVRIIAFLGRILVFEIPALLYLGFWLGKEIYYLVTDLRGGGNGGVAFGAHVGGFIAGAIWIWAFYGWNTGEKLDEEAMMSGPAVYTASEPPPVRGNVR